jgi:thiol-disulfide isomerase/thioredoxin
MNLKSVALAILGLLFFEFALGQQFGFTPEKYLNKEFQFTGLTTLGSEQISSNSLKGKPTHINFWFTTCKPCIEEMGVLNSVKKTLQESVNFISITYDTQETVALFLETHTFDFTHITDAQTLTDKLDMETWPVNMFLDKNGIVTQIEIGLPQVMGANNKPMLRGGRQFVDILEKLLAK